MARIFLGIGTGRCGTVSLFKLLANIEGVYCTHEHPPLLPWWVDEDLFRIHAERLESQRSEWAGDVAFYWLPYLRLAFERWPDLRIIVLQRERRATIESYMRKTIGRNHWVDHDGTIWRTDSTWDPCYPKARRWSERQQKMVPLRLSKRALLGLYYDEYYRAAYEWLKKYPDQIFWMDTEDLNTQEGQAELFDFLGIPPYNWQFLLPCRFNVGED